MLSVSFQSDVREVFDKVRKEHQRQIPFAASRALNDLAFETREYLKKQMDIIYDGGATRYTKNGIYSSKTNKRELHTRVYVGGRDPHRTAYILNTINGGKIPVDKEGGKPFAPNKSKIRVTKTGWNMPHKFVSRNLPKPAHFIYHAIPGKPKGKTGKMPSGLYQRVGKGKRMKIKLLVAFYDDQVNKDTFKAREMALEFSLRNFNKIMGKALAYAIATAK